MTSRSLSTETTSLKAAGDGAVTAATGHWSLDKARKRKELMLDDDVLNTKSVIYRRFSTWRRYVYYALCLLTGGTAWVVGQWPGVSISKLRWLSTPCSADAAELVIVTSADGVVEACPVERVAEVSREMTHWRARKSVRLRDIPPSERMFVFRHLRFVFDVGARTYRLLDCEAHTMDTMRATGLSTNEAAAKLVKFGRNVIDIPIAPWYVLLIRECVHPFVVFQLWAVIVWLTENYYSFSAFIFVTAIATAAMNFWEVRKNLRDIRALSLHVASVRVVRGGVVVSLPSDQLVPGDIVHLENDQRLPCDCVLLEGQATVNEAMLTGESTVVIKQPVTYGSMGGARSGPEVNDAECRNTLFGGSVVVQLRVSTGAAVTALVARTGFESVKGRLVLSILYPKVPTFKFTQQSLMFIGALFLLAMMGFAVNAKELSSLGVGVAKIVQRGCDMVTIVVPPALPLALTVGIAYALLALRKRRIYCISPPRVNLAGKINCFCFDKTGTLTTEGLEMKCVRPVRHTAGVSPVAAVPAFEEDVAQVCGLDEHMSFLMATCHTLTHVKEALAGDPLDLQTFNFTGSSMWEPHVSHLMHDVTLRAEEEGAVALVFLPPPCTVAPNPVTAPDSMSNPMLVRSKRSESSDAVLSASGAYNSLSVELSPLPGAACRLPTAHCSRLVVLRHFEFVPALQRMSVLVRVPDGRVFSYVKGSPEMIQSLSTPSSVPSNWHAVLAQYTHKGFRVLAAGWREYTGPVHPNGVSVTVEAIRAQAETGLTYGGLIVLENRLKEETLPAMRQLRSEADILLHMITGDNPVSAVCVARDCEIVEPGYRVFIGDLRSEVAHTHSALPAGASAAFTLAWVDVDDPTTVLDPDSLLPVSLAAGAPSALPASAASTRPYRLAMTGRAYAALHQLAQDGRVSHAYFQKAVLNCAVFARASPEHKASVVEALQGTGLYVGMIGDGANDSLALRAAHVGISLSQVEASVSAPFSSLIPNISCIHPVLCEGRGSLATSVKLFQFMALYSTIQFANALLIVFCNSFLANNQYMYQDLFVVFFLSLVMGSTPSATRLTRKRPTANLLSLYNLLLCAGFIVVTFVPQLIVFLRVRRQAWYDTPEYPAAMSADDDPEGTNSVIPETTSVFLVAMLQYVAIATIFSVGYPWKKMTYHNWMFTTWLAIIFGVSVFLYVVQQRELYKFLSLQVLPHEWHMEVFAWSWGAFGGYFVFTAFLVAIKRAGAIRALQRGCRRAFRRTETVSAHKTVRQAWKRVWTAPRGGGKLQGANAASLALASASGAGGSSSMVAEWEKRLEEPDYQMSPLVIGTKA